MAKMTRKAPIKPMLDASVINNAVRRGALNLSEIPIEEISRPSGIFYGRNEGDYLVIRCRARIPIIARANFGRAGVMAVRIGDANRFVNLGIIEGEKEGSHLEVATFLEAGEDIITFACQRSEVSGLQLRISAELETIAAGSAKDKLWAFPILSRNTLVKASGVNYTVGRGRRRTAGNTLISFYVNGALVYSNEASGSTEVSFEDKPAGLVLTSRPTLHMVGGSDNAVQWEVGMKVMPKVF